MNNKLPIKLKELIIDVLSHSHDFIFDESNVMPFKIKLCGVEYYLYVKNVTSANFPNSPDVSRVQLPARNIFKPIAKSNIPFILLGYDGENDVIVCWNPHNLKDRLNNSENVSLYSRQSVQNDISLDEFREAYLKTGEKIILFKRKNLLDFFARLNTIFPAPSGCKEYNVAGTKNDIEIDAKFNDKLSTIPDADLAEKIKIELRAHRTLNAVTMAMEFYKDQYPEMTLSDWAPIVRHLLDNSTIPQEQIGLSQVAEPKPLYENNSNNKLF